MFYLNDLRYYMPAQTVTQQDPSLTKAGTPRKSTPGHGGVRAGQGRPKGVTVGSTASSYERLAKAKAEREEYRAMLTEMEYRQKAGELIPVAVHERELAAVLKVVAVTIESLPDVLERDAGITGLAVERAQMTCDRVRESIYKRLLELAEKASGSV